MNPKLILALALVLLALVCASITIYNMYNESNNEGVIKINISNGAEFEFAHDICVMFNRKCSFNIMPNSSIYLTNRNYSITAPISLGDNSRIVGRGNLTRLIVDISENDSAIIINNNSNFVEISNIYIDFKNGNFM